MKCQHVSSIEVRCCTRLHRCPWSWPLTTGQRCWHARWTHYSCKSNRPSKWSWWTTLGRQMPRSNLSSDRYASRGVRYVREDIAGLGRAHNAGLASARGEIIAITDDDVIVDGQWIAALLEAFVETGAACVTGLILPVELQNP